jgi:hypothetical protein
MMFHAQVEQIKPLQPVPLAPSVRKKKRKKVPMRDEHNPNKGDRQERDSGDPPRDDDQPPIIDEYA